MANRVPYQALQFDKGFIRELACAPVTNRQRLDVVSQALRSAIENELTPRQQEVILLAYFERLSGREIAARLGVNPSTVCRTRQRAMERLRHSLRFYVEFLNCALGDE